MSQNIGDRATHKISSTDSKYAAPWKGSGRVSPRRPNLLALIIDDLTLPVHNIIIFKRFVFLRSSKFYGSFSIFWAFSIPFVNILLVMASPSWRSMASLSFNPFISKYPSAAGPPEINKRDSRITLTPERPLS